MTTQERLEKEVEEYNRLVELRNEVEHQLQQRQGRISLLKELADEEADTSSPENSDK